MSKIEVFCGKAAPKNNVRSVGQRLQVSENDIKTDVKALNIQDAVLVIIGGDGTINLVMNKIARDEDQPKVIIVFPAGTSNAFHKAISYVNAQVDLESLLENSEVGLNIKPGTLNNSLVFLTDVGIGEGPDKLGASISNLEKFGLRGRPRAPLAATLSTIAMAVQNSHNSNNLFQLCSAISHFGSNLLLPDQRVNDQENLTLLTLKSPEKTAAFAHLALAYLFLSRGLAPEPLFNKQTKNEFNLHASSETAWIAGDTMHIGSPNLVIKRSSRKYRMCAGV